MSLKQSLSRAAMKLMLSLPESWLIGMSGKRPVRIGGRQLDPHFQFIAYQARKQPSLNTLPPAKAREVAARGTELLKGEMVDGVTFEDSEIKLAKRNLPIRIYRPFGQDPNMPLMVYFHSGGGVIGDLDTCHEFCGLLAHICKCPVVSVDYRLAPEHKWPAGLEDAIAAYEWGMQEAETFGAPPGQAAIGGDSMGANYCAVIAQEMMLDHKPQPALQLLIYPMTDADSDTPSVHLYGDTFPLNSEMMAWFKDLLLPPDIDPENPRLSPLCNSKLEGLAPTILMTAGFDPLVDQGKAYADRLHDAGVDVIYRCYDSLPHGFVSFMGASSEVRRACNEIAIETRDVLRS